MDLMETSTTIIIYERSNNFSVVDQWEVAVQWFGKILITEVSWKQNYT